MLNDDDDVLRRKHLGAALAIATVATVLLTIGAYGLTQNLAHDGLLKRVSSGSIRCTMLASLPAIRDSTATYLVGVANSDTVLAGPGVIGRPLLSRREERRVYGQVVH